MLVESLKKLSGYTIHASDGEIGKVDDFYFDDHEWTVRYIVVSTGSWLSGRKVLLAPEVFGQPDEAKRSFPVHLTRQQVQDSPDVDTAKPVSRQQEMDLRNYYGWEYYWTGGIATGMSPMPLGAVPVTGESHRGIDPAERDDSEKSTPPDDRQYDPHLRSFSEVHGYSLNADDGPVGRVDDFIVDSEHWNMMYMIVDTGNLFSGRKVLVTPSWVQKVSWTDKMMDVNLKVDTIKNSPEYDPNVPLDVDYQDRLKKHYGR